MKLIETTGIHYALDLDGKRVVYPRVTTILKPVQNFDGIPEQVLENARERGTAVHRAIWLLEGGGDGSGLDMESLSEEIFPYIAAYKRAKAALRFDVRAKEMLVWSERYGFAGTMDLLVTMRRGNDTVLDLKSGAEHPAHGLQLAAYCLAHSERTGQKRGVGRAVLYLRSDGTYRLHEPKPEHHVRDTNTFLALLSVYRWQEAVGRHAA